MDPRLEEYLKQKMQAQQQYGEQADSLNAASAFSNLGDVIAGKQVGSGNPYFERQRALAQENTLGDLEKQRQFGLEQSKIESSKLKEEEDRAWRQEQAKANLDMKLRQMAQDKELKSQGLAQQREGLAQRSSDKAMKDQELSATQAKQLGLAEMGQLANKQYEEAISKGKKSGEFDPTSYGDIIDSSSWAPQFMKSASAKEAMSAQSSWIESYLRDASGAAIPPSERGAYASDYFPRPGDTPETVKNKAMLRAQKEKAALTGAGPGAKQFQKSEPQEAPKVERKIVGGKSYVKVPGGWKKEGE